MHILHKATFVTGIAIGIVLISLVVITILPSAINDANYTWKQMNEENIDDKMIVISYEILLEENESIDKFRDAFRIMEEQSKKENGNLIYASSVDISNSSMVRIYELWESSESLKPHFKTQHIQDFQESLKELQIKEYNVKVYVIDKEISIDDLR